MMERQSSIDDIDQSLAIRIAELSRGGQRWLKTALQSIAVTDLLDETADEALRRPIARAKRAPGLPAPEKEPPASLEDVITGKADLRDHLEAYPELQDELDGLADVIDLLREAGETRRKRGEQILREEILGTAGEGEEDEGEGGDEEGRPRRRRS